MSISQLFPEEGPSLNLNFAGSRILDPRIIFSRSQTTSNGSTYMGRDGLIKYAGPDEPRFDHRYVNGEVESLGLLIERVRQNIVRRSQDFTIASGYWSEIGDGVTVTTDQATAPDGTQTADKVSIKTTGLGGKGIQSSILNPSVASQAYTVSIFLKAAEHSFVRVQFEGGGNTDGINVNLQNGTLISLVGVPDSYSIIPYPNNWHRIVVTNTAANTNASALRWFLVDSNGNANFEGTVGNGVYAWGGQFETGSYVTSYIPTENSEVTRNQDRVLIDGERFTEWYNPDEGTFFCSTNDPRGTVIFGVGNTFDNVIYVTRGGGSMLSNTVGSSLSTSSLIGATGNSKIAFAVKTDNSSICVNGTITANNTTNDMPIGVVRLVIGASSWSSTAFDNQVDGTIAQLTYYPTRLPNSQLISLTR